MDDGSFGVFLFKAFVVIFYASCAWKLLDKMGKPGWAALVPVYNAYVFTQALNKPFSWFILLLVPGPNVVVGLMMLWDLIKCFGKKPAYFVATLLIHPVMLAVLGFGESTFTPPPAEVVHRPATVTT